MRFFEFLEPRVKPDEFRLAFEQGVQLGALRAELDRLRADVTTLQANQPAGHGLPALDANIVHAVTKLSRNDPALYRLLESQAKELLAKGIAVEHVVQQLEMGHRGPRRVSEATG